MVGQQSYYPLDAALVERLQAQKLLPSPLPPYSLSALDYLIGYLLWFIVAGVVVSILFAWRKQRQQKQAVPFAAAGLAHHRSGNLDAAIAEYDKAPEGLTPARSANRTGRGGLVVHSPRHLRRRCIGFKDSLTLTGS